jgi:hypothetical protein
MCLIFSSNVTNFNKANANKIIKASKAEAASSIPAKKI